MLPVLLPPLPPKQRVSLAPAEVALAASTTAQDRQLTCATLRPQITVSTHAFVYDHVFGSGGGLPPACLYNTCVLPLVHGLFKGYNATVLAYGAPP